NPKLPVPAAGVVSGFFNFHEPCATIVSINSGESTFGAATPGVFGFAVGTGVTTLVSFGLLLFFALNVAETTSARIAIDVCGFQFTGSSLNGSSNPGWRGSDGGPLHGTAIATDRFTT